MVVVAVAATMIASQAVITGAFSVTRQAVQLGFLPQLRIRHKSGSEGQVYVPAVNWLLYIAVVAVVIDFGSAANLASAYGIAVTGTFATTTVLYFVVVRMLWKKSLWIVLPGAAAFITVDLAFFSANLTKVVSGGWFPLAIALIIFTLLSTWQRGRGLVTAKRSQAEGRLRDFIEEVRTMDPRWTACRGRRSSSPWASRRHRWRCGPTSTTTTCCTRTSSSCRSRPRRS